MTNNYLTSKERFNRIYNHKEADRIPIIDSPWNSTVERWHREGMPNGIGFVEYFDLDLIADITIKHAPWDEYEILEETEKHGIYKNVWGTVFKQWKHTASTPEYLEFGVKNPDEWNTAKETLSHFSDAINWKFLKNNYRNWKEKGYWIQAHLWFGFDILHSWIVGTERMLIAMIENPEWCRDMFSYLLEYYISRLNKIWDAGYEFDAMTFPDDLGYKKNQFFSLNTYRDVLKSYHQRAVEWAHEKGIKAHVHSCGDVNPFIPEFIKIGVDALNPLEVKAGMDPIFLKQKYGKDLVLHGGVNAVLWDKPEQIKAEMERLIAILKENGGYIFSSDHSVPDSVSLNDFRAIINLAKELGTY